MPRFERLDVRERLAFDLEDEHVHLHSATACVLEAGPLTREGGGVDIERIRALVESRLYRVPLCRKRIVRVPIEARPSGSTTRTSTSSSTCATRTCPCPATSVC
jgi:hypothetical protein